MFLSIDLFRRLTLTTLASLQSRLRMYLLVQETSHKQKTKGLPNGRFHSDAQVSIRAKKHQVCILASVLEIAYLTRDLGTLYIG